MREIVCVILEVIAFIGVFIGLLALAVWVGRRELKAYQKFKERG